LPSGCHSSGASWPGRQNVAVPVRVDVNPDLLAWARERSGVALDDLTRRFPKLAEWEEGDRSPTLRQLEQFARATRTPVGYLFLDAPPDEPLPIPDYRTRHGVRVARPSPELLDTIFQCLQRQEWYRDFALGAGQDELAFVGSVTTATPVTEAAAAMRDALDFGVAARAATWTSTLRLLVTRAEEIGVLVMVNGVVGNNTHRKLDPDEFQGFALVDRLAPVVFVNGADTKAAQIFTLSHELAHIWVGQSAVSNAAAVVLRPDAAVERWCNAVAAEFLVPVATLRQQFDRDAHLAEELERLATRFKVSTLVVLRRIYEADLIGADVYAATFEAELRRLRAIMASERSGTTGGDFYNTEGLRVGHRFARAVIESTLEGQTLYRDAFQMLGFKKFETFEGLATRLRDA
jgi:Zn-dependent peptidase ImmA (M78 family)/transcriptional regulator with XRE-family HTH domain